MSIAKKSSFVIVYHRQPYEEAVENGRPVLRENKSPNGIVPALKGFFSSANDAVWVAWKLAPGEGKPAFERTVRIKDSYGEYDVVRLPLTAEQVKAFYHVTSKEALWPILHSFPGRFNYGPADWENFREVNRLFAEAACEQAADDALIWVHDYNLWLVPYYVRQLKPDARIAFFHHTPFPAPDVFNVLPWREEILASLLSCDVVGFHIPRYAENFAATACAMMGAERGLSSAAQSPFERAGVALAEPNVTESLHYQGRQVSIDVWPIGANPALIDQYLAADKARARVAEIEREIGDRRFFVSVGRVDYVKGTKEMLEAFGRLLERRPELREKVKLFCVCVAPAEGMSAYRGAQREIERLVGAINGRFGNLSWTPIMLSTRGVPFEDLVCYYRAADVCLVTPLRDGLNLVAKEFIAAQGDDAGVLVLSEFAGAAVELPEAVLVNPYSERKLDAALDLAIDMDRGERVRRAAAMSERVRRWDVDHWAGHVRDRFDAIAPASAPVTKTAA
ncbi:MAG: glucosylglycerol-phosphate synthase [Hyphomonadaceae bacterium]